FRSPLLVVLLGFARSCARRRKSRGDAALGCCVGRTLVRLAGCCVGRSSTHFVSIATHVAADAPVRPVERSSTHFVSIATHVAADAPVRPVEHSSTDHPTVYCRKIPCRSEPSVAAL